MSSLIFIAAIFLVVLVVITVIKSISSGKGSIGFPYQPAKTLFSAAERSFLGVLDQAVGAEYRVFGKVRVADIASVKAGLSKSAHQGALNRIAAKHFDFVVCRANDLSVVCVVELNDKSHSSKRALNRDDLLAKVCQSIQLPLLTVPAKQAYSMAELREKFHSTISKSNVPAGT